LKNKDNTKPMLASGLKIYAAFGLGLATAIAFRALIIIDHLQPALVRPVWYFAVVGNFVFFFHRFRISQKRKKVVADYRLREKIRRSEELTPADREALGYLLNSIKKSPENINYLIIFVFSLVAIAIDLAISYFSNL